MSESIQTDPDGYKRKWRNSSPNSVSQGEYGPSLPRDETERFHPELRVTLRKPARRWLLPVTLAFLGSAVLIWDLSGWSSRRAEENYNRGVEALHRRDLDQAVDCFTKAIKLAPRNAEAYFYRGEAWSEKKDDGSAVADYTVAICLVPGHATATFKRGQALFRLKEYERAVADFTKAISLEPENPDAYFNRGLALSQQKKYDDAIEDFTEAIRLKPNYSTAFVNRGIAHAAKANQEKAMLDFNEAIRVDPTNPNGYSERGQVHAKRLDLDRAIADYTEVILLDPRTVLTSGGWCCSNAFAIATEDARLNTAFVRAYGNRGYAFHIQQKYDLAIKDYTQAIWLDPSDSTWYYHRGNAHSCKRDYDEATENYTSAINFNPKYAEAYSERGNAFYHRHNYDKAVEDVIQAAVLGPSNPKFSCYAAWYLATCPKDRLRDGKKALEYAKNACLSTNWTDANCLEALAAAYAESGDCKQAVTWQRKAIDLGFFTQEQLKQARQRLAFYEERKPYREP